MDRGGKEKWDEEDGPKGSDNCEKSCNITPQKGISAPLLGLRHTWTDKAAMNSEHGLIPWALMYVLQSTLCAKQVKRKHTPDP